MSDADGTHEIRTEAAPGDRPSSAMSEAARAAPGAGFTRQRAALPPRSAYRRYWLPELVIVLALIAVTTVVFAATDLDLRAASFFYRPGHPDGAWPVAERGLWLFLYRSSPYVTGVLAIVAIAFVLAGTFGARLGRLRLYGAFMLLSGFLGPGLVVNGILKDYWGHPRPRQLREFGGRADYVVKPLPGTIGSGKSFPCGHSSVGFLYGVFWFVLRRKRRGLAAASLAFAGTLGGLLGVSRMAAGGHFLSDVLWSAYLPHLVSLVVYYLWLNIPGREDAAAKARARRTRTRRERMLVVAGMCAVLAIVSFIFLYAHPNYKDIRFRLAPSEAPGGRFDLELRVDTADVEIALVDEPEVVLEGEGYIRGFGFPTNRLEVSARLSGRSPPAFVFRLEEEGLFSDLDASVKIRARAGRLRRIIARVRSGDVMLADEASGHALPELDVETQEGELVLPAGRDPSGGPGAHSP